MAWLQFVLDIIEKICGSQHFLEIFLINDQILYVMEKKLPFKNPIKTMIVRYV